MMISNNSYARVCVWLVQLSWLIAFLGPLFWAKRWGWQHKLSLVIVWPGSTYLSWRPQNVYGHISRILVMTRGGAGLGFIRKIVSYLSYSSMYINPTQLLFPFTYRSNKLWEAISYHDGLRICKGTLVQTLNGKAVLHTLSQFSNYIANFVHFKEEWGRQILPIF